MRQYRLRNGLSDLSIAADEKQMRCPARIIGNTYIRAKVPCSKNDSQTNSRFVCPKNRSRKPNRVAA